MYCKTNFSRARILIDFEQLEFSLFFFTILGKAYYFACAFRGRYVTECVFFLSLSFHLIFYFLYFIIFPVSHIGTQPL